MRDSNKFLFLAIVALSSLSVARAQKRLCNDTLGECVSIQRCSDTIEFNDGSKMFQVRFGDDEEEVESCHYLEKCCDPENIIEETADPFPPPGTDKTNSLIPSEDLTRNKNSDGSTGEDFSRDPLVTTQRTPPTLPPNFTVEVHGGGPDGDGDGDGDDAFPEDDEEPVTIQPAISRVPLPDTTPAIEINPETDCPDDTHKCIPYFLCSEGSNDGSSTLKSRLGLACSASSDICCEHGKNIANHKPTKCGVRHPDGVGYQIANSHDEAQYGEFPWMAALSGESAEGGFEYVCGGSLIHPSVVLSAGHCVHNRVAEKMRVRLGEWDTQTRNEIFAHTDHEVSQIIIHESFGPMNLFNDIALLVLQVPATLSMVVNTICLPPQNFRFEHGKYGIASGWGADLYEQKGLYRANLKKIDLPVVQLKTCQDQLRATKLGPRFKLNTSFMCAGGEKGVDTCTGDGGSPLVYPIDDNHDRYFQAGIVAWGLECAQENVPGVYANVAKFRSWIDQHMKALNFGTGSYTYTH